ncbi:MAG: MBL fold metallo-hydrolase [Verrucomicrobiota bacterium]
MQVHTLDLQFQGQSGLIAAFLIQGDASAVLIETGPETCRERLLSAIREVGVSPDSIDGVFVTHVHLDHAGGAGWWARQRVPIFAHPKAVRHLVDPSRLVDSARLVYGDRFETLWGGMLPSDETSVRAIANGEVVDVGGVQVQAIESLGHAFHHHAFAVGDSVFAGDAAGARLFASGYTSVTSAPPQFHLEYTLASIDRIEQADFSRLFLTHFGEVDSPRDHLLAYREQVEEATAFLKQQMDGKACEESLREAYRSFQKARADALQLKQEHWRGYELINGTEMCADGIRLFWEKQAGEGA